MSRIKGRKAFYLLTALFFILGLITVLVDSLIPRLKDVFTLTYFQAGFIQFAFFGAYFLLSIPSSYFLSKVGYQKGTQFSLFLMGLGCLLFLPAANYRVFSLFALACFTLAGGMTLLQVSINPFITELGSPETAAKRLTLAQAFNSLGTTIAPAIGAMFILRDRVIEQSTIDLMNEAEKLAYYDLEAAAVNAPFMVLAAILVGLGMIFIWFKMPSIIPPRSIGSYAQALKNKRLKMGMLGIFCYVGAEVSLGSYLVNYFISLDAANLIIQSEGLRSFVSSILDENLTSYDEKAIVGVFITFYWGGAMIGRFFGAFIMQYIPPAKVILGFGLMAFSFLTLSINTAGLLAMFAALAVGFCNSIMFPTIFSLALQELGELKPKGSGLLCTAIVGGALIPPTFGALIDWKGFAIAMLLIMACYLYLSYLGFYFQKREARASTLSAD